MNGLYGKKPDANTNTATGSSKFASVRRSFIVGSFRDLETVGEGIGLLNFLDQAWRTPGCYGAICRYALAECNSPQPTRQGCQAKEHKWVGDGDAVGGGEAQETLLEAG